MDSWSKTAIEITRPPPPLLWYGTFGIYDFCFAASKLSYIILHHNLPGAPRALIKSVKHLSIFDVKGER